MKAAKRPPKMAREPVATLLTAALPVAVTTPPVLLAVAVEKVVLNVTLDPDVAVWVPFKAVPFEDGATYGVVTGEVVETVKDG